ncbi:MULTISPECIES: LysR family transcriptional regulator [Proteus]|jgi:DNA-binding transcriptional LysR family regulator|uniref:LysR-family transcriptional regulator n=1 Tax=Proteus vulgaris TaxID=585 RepID=A0A379F4X7_PROVU|nr:MULTISPECIES: LysR family transcriptional regulator [Proteus]NBN61543.1 LysR family transcriptional regulator [Proteus sp. G2639]RNT26608.1 LysR family transcriptional regulator [Proteus mirabilis]AYY80086.1 LysR family transcriptional regulator [Proteus vulgaris]KGA59648.1 bacterial regulatory helix-turn-helix, lysR family protein [Proteus vulgaris]MBG5971621.1 LysR family transcriptional regulator [Proteus vulgaris]
MNYSIETLRTFVEAASLKSFSATARKLNKSQSTVSSTIAGFEDDMGFELFERKGRESTLTFAGQKVLSLVEDILAADERLQALRIDLSSEMEPRLSCVFSDMYQPPYSEQLLKILDTEFPHLEFEFLVAENDDVINMLQNNQAHIGMMESRIEYPADIAFARLPVSGKLGLYAHKTHPLVKEKKINYQHLTMHRQLRLSSRAQFAINSEKNWLAPNYLLLLEMAEQEMGWAILPTWLVEQFGHNLLVSLNYDQFPKKIDIDLVWSRSNPPGKAGYWMIDRLLKNDLKFSL